MNILIIAPLFAPSSEVGAVRMLSLSDYLVKQGHNITVVCWSKDSLLEIYKEEELRSKAPKGVNVVRFSSTNNNIPVFKDIIWGYECKRIIPKMINLVSFDIALVTCGPYFTLEAMPYFKKKYGLRYVIDFRDLGALNYRPKHTGRVVKNKSRCLKTLKQIMESILSVKERRRESLAVKNAERIICVSEIDKDKMKSAYELPNENCIIATNGFDDEKLKYISAVDREEGIVGAVFGKFMYYSKSRAEALLRSIQKKRNEGVRVKLKHIGRNYDYIEESISANGFDRDILESCGLKDYSEGMSMLGSADFFVVEDTSPDDVGTKIYDYIYWNKPIIAAVSKDIPLAKLVSSFEHGYVCETDIEIENALSAIIKNGYNVLDCNLDRMKYSRRFQNQKIEKVLMDAVFGG